MCVCVCVSVRGVCVECVGGCDSVCRERLKGRRRKVKGGRREAEGRDEGERLKRGREQRG